MTEKIRNITEELLNYRPEEGDSIEWLRYTITELKNEVSKLQKLYCYSKPNTMDGYLQNGDCHRYTDDVAFVMELLEKSGVLCTPGSSFGSLGKGHVRFALTLPVEEIMEAVKAVEASGMIEKEC